MKKNLLVNLFLITAMIYPGYFAAAANDGTSHPYTSQVALNDGVVCVSAFNDLNGNGIQDEDEPGMEGVVIVVTEAPMEFEFLLPYAASTDAAGAYCFTGLPYGLYTFMVEVPEGYEMEGSPYFSVEVEPEAEPVAYQYGINSVMSTAANQKSGFTVHPNPAVNTIAFDSEHFADDIELVVFDMSGKQVVKEKLLHGQISVDISNLVDGIYFAQLTSAERTESVRFIVRR